MKILADENIPDKLVDELRSAGYDVATPPRGAEDSDIAALAKKEGRVILTQDKDFANIILYPPKSFHGIIRIRMHPPVISDILRSLKDLFQKFSRKDLEKKLIILEKDGFRVRL